MARDLALPIAIVVGAALIGGGLYMGLRERPIVNPPTAAPTGVDASSGAAAPTSAAPPTPTPENPPQEASTPNAEARKRVEGDVAKALPALKAEWKKKCWEPVLKKTP